MKQSKPYVGMDVDIFTQTYYLKEELMLFCKQEGLQSSGSKQVLAKVIEHYLLYQEKLVIKSKKRVFVEPTLTARIVENMAYSEPLRAFFESYYPDFHFSVPFQRWLKANVNKTLQDAVRVYPTLEKNKEIDAQFEYNTYFRDFFADNKGASKELAIACWNYKKRQLGSHRYEKEDLLHIK